MAERINGGDSGDIGFQFIGFPSEWGAKTIMKIIPPPLKDRVSNLLGSPASGEQNGKKFLRDFTPVSNLLGSPASGELVAKMAMRRL